MYCSSCGTEVTKELNYCNRCGANLNPTVDVVEQPVRLVSMNGPFWVMAMMAIIGLGIIFAGINTLADKGLHPAALTWLGIGSLATLFAIVALFMRQLSHLSGQSKPERPPKRLKAEKETVVRTGQLPPMRMHPVSSVTEETTRTFEPIERGR